MGLEKYENSEYIKFIEQGLQVAKAIPKYFSRFSNKIFSNHQKLILLVLRQKLNSNYRNLIELLKITNIPKIIGLKRIPHFTTLIRFSRKLSPILVRKLLIYSCRMSKPKKLKLGVDATGLSTDKGSSYYIMRMGKMQKQRRVIQITACALLDKQLVSSIRLQRRKTVVNNLFMPVVRESAEIADVKYVAADKGYDGNFNHHFVMKYLNAQSLICIKKTKFKKHWIKKLAEKQFDKKLYHQRSKIETIFSVIKRKYGSSVYGKSGLTQKREGMQKVITYNIDRLTKIIFQIILGFHQS